MRIRNFKKARLHIKRQMRRLQEALLDTSVYDDEGYENLEQTLIAISRMANKQEFFNLKWRSMIVTEEQDC